MPQIPINNWKNSDVFNVIKLHSVYFSSITEFIYSNNFIILSNFTDNMFESSEDSNQFVFVLEQLSLFLDYFEDNIKISIKNELEYYLNAILNDKFNDKSVSKQIPYNNNDISMEIKNTKTIDSVSLVVDILIQFYIVPVVNTILINVKSINNSNVFKLIYDYWMLFNKKVPLRTYKRLLILQNNVNNILNTTAQDLLEILQDLEPLIDLINYSNLLQIVILTKITKSREIVRNLILRE